MYKLEKTDKIILSELDTNARQSNTKIAKKTKLPLHVVNYRIKKLIKDNIISKFTTLIPLSRLGFFVYKIYFQLTGLPTEKEKIMLDDFVKNKKIHWVAKTEGRWDLMIAIYTKDSIEFGKVKEEIFFKYGNYFSDYSISMLKETYVLGRSYLLDTKEILSESLYIGGNKFVKLSNLDKKLIKLLVNNCTYTTLELSKKLKINVKTVMSKIKELKKIGIIQKFTIFLNVNKLDYKYYKLCIYLKNINKQNYTKIINYCKSHPNVIHLMECIGSWEIELEIEVKSDEEFYKINRDIRNLFTNNVKRTESVIISDEMKLDWSPI